MFHIIRPNRTHVCHLSMASFISNRQRHLFTSSTAFLRRYYSQKQVDNGGQSQNLDQSQVDGQRNQKNDINQSIGDEDNEACLYETPDSATRDADVEFKTFTVHRRPYTERFLPFDPTLFPIMYTHTNYYPPKAQSPAGNELHKGTVVVEYYLIRKRRIWMYLLIAIALINGAWDGAKWCKDMYTKHNRRIKDGESHPSKMTESSNSAGKNTREDTVAKAPEAVAAASAAADEYQQHVQQFLESSNTKSNDADTKSNSVHSSTKHVVLPPQFTIQRLQEKDVENGLFEVLIQLTDAPLLPKEKYRAILQHMRRNEQDYYTVVLHDTANGNRVVGTATLLSEQKLIHDGKRVGHIEDVVIDHLYRGQNLGLALVDHLVDYGRQHGCYKIILDCESSMMRFYEQLGFKENSRHMALYF